MHLILKTFVDFSHFNSENSSIFAHQKQFLLKILTP